MKKQLLISIAVLLALTSCNTYYYFPDRVPATGFREKGEVMVNGSLKPGIFGKAWSGDAAWAFAHNFYVSGSLVHQLDMLSGGWSPVLSFSGYRGEIQVGCFKAINPAWSFETALSYGRGSVYRFEVFGNARLPNNNPIKSLAERTDSSGYNRFSAHCAAIYQCARYYRIAFGLQCTMHTGYAFTQNTYEVNNPSSVSAFQVYFHNEVGRALYFHSQIGWSIAGPTQIINDGARPYFAAGIGYHYFGRKKKGIQNPT